MPARPTGTPVTCSTLTGVSGDVDQGLLQRIVGSHRDALPTHQARLTHPVMLPLRARSLALSGRGKPVGFPGQVPDGGIHGAHP